MHHDSNRISSAARLVCARRDEVGSGRKWDWVALMIDVDPDDLKNCTCDFLQRWVRVPGKHRNQDAAWDALQNMTATRH